MTPAILRPHLAWWQRTQTKPPSLPPSAVGGTELPPPMSGVLPKVVPCPEPGCPVAGEVQDVYLHAFEQHGRDRRRSERRSAA